MRLRVEYVHDDEAGTWAFHVPGLHVVGGGDLTRSEAERHCMDAIAFALECMADESPPAAGDVVEYEVQLIPVG